MTESRARMRYDRNVNPAHEVRLKDRTPRGQQRSNAGCMIVLGVPFAAAGVAAIGGSLGWIRMESSPESPRWVAAAGGAIFVITGLLVLLGGVRQALEDSRRSSLRRTRPSEPWLADYPWSVRPAGDGNAASAAGGLFGFAFLQLFLVPFNWWAFASPHGNLFVAAVVGLFDFVSLAILAKGLYHAIRILKYGRSELVPRRFPFFLGDTVEAEFRTNADVRRIRRLVFTLRCLREQVDVQAAGSGLNLAVFEIWKDEQVVEPPSRVIPVSFRLPVERHFSTELNIMTPRYWELEVTGEAPGVDFGARFLLPVYGKGVEG